MRYDKPIYFQTLKKGTYNTSTGDYDDDTVVEEVAYASVMDTKTETMMLVYGQLKKGSLTCQIQNSYDKSFDFIRIGSKKYRADYIRNLRTKETFILSEVM